MRKILAMLFACSMVLAGCIDLTDEDVAEIVDELVDIAGCNDATAYNYDENATNNNACLTELVLKDSVTQFIHLVNEGPEWGETAGFVMAGSEVDDDGATTSFSTTGAMSPDGMYTMVVMDMGMMSIEMGELITENADGSTNIVTTWMGNTFQMNSAAIFAETWNEQTYNQDDDERDDDDDINDVVVQSEGDDGNDDNSGIDARDDHMSSDNDGNDLYVSNLPTDEMEFISLLDADTSGGISYGEFVQFVVDTIGPMTDQQLDYWTTDAEIFGDSDTDNSGEIEQGENFYLLLEELDYIFENVFYYGLDDVREFLCEDGTLAIQPHQVNDGYEDCPDGSDETDGGMDDHDDDHDDYDDDMDDDMGDDFDMGLPDTEVSIPENFDPATAMFELGLVTANGYSFSTTLDDSMGHSVTMTFTLSLTFEVTQMVMVETDASGMSSTSSITVLDTESVETLLTNDDTLMHHALPFILEPMGYDDHDDHDDHGDHGDDDHGDHGDDDHGDHGDDGHHDDSYVFYCSNDGEEYANSMGGILCPEGAGEVPTCPDGEPCVCIDVDGSCTDGDDDWGYEDHDGHDDNGNGETMTASDIMASADSDASETLTLTEFMDFMFSGTTHDSIQENISNIFYWADYNEDYELDINELSDFIPEFESYMISMESGSNDDQDIIYAVEERYLSVQDLYSAWGDVFANAAQNCVNCAGNLANMVADAQIDIADEQSFGQVVGNYEFYYFQYIDENGNQDYDDGELFAVSAEIIDDDDVRGVIAYDGQVFLDDSGSGSYPYETFWENAYDFTWVMDENEEDDNTEMFICDNGEEIPTDWVNDGTDDCGDGSDEFDEVDNTTYFTCDNGNEIPSYWVDDGMDDCGDGSDESDDHDGHDHHDHGPAVDWMIGTADMMSPIEVAGSFADYHIALASCTMDSGPDEDGNMEPTDMVETNAMTCGDDVIKISIADATAPGADVMFHDADDSGTITQGDMVHINPDFDAGGEWNMVRLYSNSSDKYSDENPMLPGFGAAAGIIALLSAALIARRD